MFAVPKLAVTTARIEPSGTSTLTADQNGQADPPACDPPVHASDAETEHSAVGRAVVLEPQIGHNVGFQAQISTQSAWTPSRA